MNDSTLPEQFVFPGFAEGQTASVNPAPGENSIAKSSVASPVTIAEALNIAPQTPPRDRPKRSPLTIRSIDEILSLTVSPSDLILDCGYIERGERTAICGMGGIGKSRLIMQLAMVHRAGLPFLAWQTRASQLRWLFLQTENGVRRLQSDLMTMLTGFTATQQTAIKQGIFIHTLESEDDGNLLLSDPQNQLRAIDAIQQCHADIVVWDPLRDCTGDDLNKDAAMSETLRTIRSVSRNGDPMRTTIIIHHAGEGKGGVAKATGYDRGAFGRNSKVLKTWARAQFNVAPATPDDNSQIIIASGKCNNFAEVDPICARLNPETLHYELVDDFDFTAWEESLAGNQSRAKATTDKISDLLSHQSGGMEKNALLDALRTSGIGKHQARELLKQAVTDDLVEETPHSRPGKKSAIFVTLKS